MFTRPGKDFVYFFSVPFMSFSAIIYTILTINMPPPHQVEVYMEGAILEDGTEIASFYIDRNLVTVAEFEKFTWETGYVTQAEKYGSSGVFDYETGSFVLVEGASYQFPFGRGQPAADPTHPVTHVSWNDAVAYAEWKGKRLPTQAEWEYAASDREKSNTKYSWGNILIENGQYKANTWQGSFPFVNSQEDGYLYTSPVGAFGENANGLNDMGGNVWQWCSDETYPAPAEKIFDPSPRKLLKGGSYLCDPAVCHGFTVFGLSSSTPETSMGHIGFRCVRDL